ncbi:hypothetical protein [Xenorhabdus bovienii]|uniref:hypothetical protein n=1 Tax=Xenorhabdus bovienii TaxID=40576 RepID=UPI0023B33B3C|nr:hypothetical protein [Xenorhabdus bovienii]MDE9535664.1 hypothetical protein [Xenorhabdus bovienii]MDE9553407.1 hypothetical protein [Xenorhabdus bovienii]MDE9588137.1 hypothetical protein [Xenorhabdus bovienii]
MSFKSTFEKIDNSLKNTPKYANSFSVLMSKLASYSVVNGLIYFFVARAFCKYPQYESFIGHLMGVFVAILFAIFLLDAFLNHLPLKAVIDKNSSIFKRCLLYIICFGGGGLLSWAYVAGIYYPLFILPSEALICKP